ncbi:HK97 family phage prohead protease [Paenibacillus graminis]|uniref:HK97 family phage prohead protease n=1 Tax=Paenibacillus graminis TaxID=189425 RepID=UPI002DBC680E|nr:HK97 family phage prohead protease [Paenibacillus graminis]MEC0172563.1 HK97 family phage prohead protease [Paenibacillus graminis]
MEKAIYGMAMPFNDFYAESDLENNTYSVERTNREGVFFDSKVGITLRHDYTQVIGTTEDGLQVQTAEGGVFFKLIPNSPFGQSIYKKVKRAALRHCSISFRKILSEQNAAEEMVCSEIFRSEGYTDEVSVHDLKEIIVHEICLTNGPANELTFCTTNMEDSRLNGLRWDNIQPIPKALIRPSERPRFDREQWLAKETEALSKDIAEFKRDVQKFKGLGGRK